MAKLILPGVLSFERKLEVSDGLMYAGSWSDADTKNPTSDSASLWQPIDVTIRKNRSTQSAFNTPEHKKSQPNPVSSDAEAACLPLDKEVLKVSFTLRVVGNLGATFGCNDPNFADKLLQQVDMFKEQGARELAYRYAHNIASGRFLWRNRVCAEQIRVDVQIKGESTLSFDSYAYSLDDFEQKRSEAKLVALEEHIFNGLFHKDTFVFLKIDAYVRLGGGQNVFPSQEMNMGEKSKVLFKLGQGRQAAMHAVKLSNAIRTIDTWYNNAQFPIAIEPFGSVTHHGKAYRKNKQEGDLYSLLVDWVNDRPISDEQKYFILGNLVRGGVFGGKNE